MKSLYNHPHVLNILESNKDDILVFYTGCYYSIPSLDELKEVSKKLLNTIENYDYFVEECNKENSKNSLLTGIQNKNHNPKFENNLKIKKGFIYLAKCNHTGFYKIGCTTKEVKNRIMQLQTANPTLELFKYFETSNILDEKLIHEYYKDKKVRGEWFNLSEQDVMSIEKKFYCPF